MKGTRPKGPPPPAPRPAAGPRTVGDATATRSFWTELILAVAPTLASEVCGEIRARMQHRREQATAKVVGKGRPS